MRSRILVRSALAGLGITAAAVGAFAMPAGAAVSVQSSSPPAISVRLGKGTVAANGAVVFTGTRVTCARGATADLSVTVTEAVGNDIASGSGYTSVSCTGNVQSVTVAVTPTQHPFRKGTAFGQARLTFCSTVRCLEASDERVIQITS